MKKFIGVFIALILIVTIFAGCDTKTYDWCDTNYGYTVAYIKLGDKWDRYEISKWTYSSFEGCVALELKVDRDIVPVVVDMKNCILIDEDDGTILKDEYCNERIK